jgi:predicted AAA+ superfamily ATPase
MQFNRFLKSHIDTDLKERMAFIGGPRQVGKTTLGKEFLKSPESYFSWDDLSDREIIKKHQFDVNLKVILLDEIHKYVRWRTLVKGLYDKRGKDLRIIVTGSARLDHFSKGGDSLFGRYHYYRMHPLSLNELNKNPSPSDLLQLMKYGGFPEPFIKQNDTFLRRWQRERQARVMQEDLRDIVNLKEYSSIDLLNTMLPERVGSLLSKTSIAEDLEKSPHTIEAWLQALESVYSCYRISPMGAPKVKALKKQQKLYLWDWTSVENVGAKFENLVASHLLKYCHYLTDVLGHSTELRYLRDVNGHEVDFVVLKDKQPIFAVECKTGERSLSSSIEYFLARTKIPKFYQVHMGSKDYGNAKSGRVLPFTNFCKEEKLV